MGGKLRNSLENSEIPSKNQKFDRKFKKSIENSEIPSKNQNFDRKFKKSIENSEIQSKIQKFRRKFRNSIGNSEILSKIQKFRRKFRNSVENSEIASLIEKTSIDSQSSKPKLGGLRQKRSITIRFYNFWVGWATCYKLTVHTYHHWISSFSWRLATN